MAIPDVSNYTAEQVQQLSAALDARAQQLAALDRIPEQVAAMATEYVECGGDVATLTAKLEEVPAADA